MVEMAEPVFERIASGRRLPSKLAHQAVGGSSAAASRIPLNPAPAEPRACDKCSRSGRAGSDQGCGQLAFAARSQSMLFAQSAHKVGAAAYAAYVAPSDWSG